MALWETMTASAVGENSRTQIQLFCCRSLCIVLPRKPSGSVSRALLLKQKELCRPNGSIYRNLSCRNSQRFFCRDVRGLLFFKMLCYECFACMYVWVPLTCLVPMENRKGGYPRTGIADICKPPCGYWESSLGPLQEQQVFSTTKPSLQVPVLYCWIK